MSDWWYTRPIRPPDRTEQERIKIPPIEEEKRIKEKFQKEQEQKGKDSFNLFHASSILLIKKLIEFFEKRQSSSSNILEVKIKLLEIFSKIKELLVQMKDSDQSQNSEFIQKLSDAWNDLCILNETLEGSKNKENIPQKEINNFITTFDNYPPDIDHSLGFYLLHHAGKDWLPFPFMEILKKIHLEFLQDEKHSHLMQWIGGIDRIIQFLSSEI
ncbi:MAG: hypothetical protein Tsb0015_03680 [Simkaniaceae bacterium]